MFGKSPRLPAKEEGVCLDESLVVNEIWRVDHKYQGTKEFRMVTLRKGAYSAEGEITWRVNQATFDLIDVDDRIEVQFRPVNPIEG